MVDATYTALAWAGLLGVAGGIYYMTQKPGKLPRPVRNNVERRMSNAKQVKQKGKAVVDEVSQRAKSVASGAAQKAKSVASGAGLTNGADVSATSGDDKSHQGKSKNKKPSTEKTAEPEREHKPIDDSKEKNEDLAFAQQYNKAQTGTVAAPQLQKAKNQKTTKQSKVTPQSHSSAVAVDAPASVASSATGADADDDESPINSPSTAATSSRNDISDMLEVSGPGPAVLKINAPTKPVVEKPKKTSASQEPTETKKQRQNRKKNEENKAAKQAAEAERKKLEEQQRRKAREAEGREAKDGKSFLAANPPSSSAWSASPTETKAVAVSETTLLDTFEPSSVPATNGVAKNGTAAHVPSEEDQIAALKQEQEENEWQVTTSKKAKKVRQPAAEVSGTKNVAPVVEKSPKPSTVAVKNIKEGNPRAKAGFAALEVQEPVEEFSWMKSTGASTAPTEEEEEWVVS